MFLDFVFSTYSTFRLKRTILGDPEVHYVLFFSIKTKHTHLMKYIVTSNEEKKIRRIFRFSSHWNIYGNRIFFFPLKYCSCRQYKRKVFDELLKFLLNVCVFVLINVSCPLNCFLACCWCYDAAAMYEYFFCARFYSIDSFLFVLCAHVS